MKFFVSLVTVLSLGAQSMASHAMASTPIGSEGLTCEEQLDIKLERLKDSNWRSTNDLTLGLGIVGPIALFVGPASVIFSLFIIPGIVFKVKASNQYHRAKLIKKIYTEATSGGGKVTRKLYRSIMKNHPELEMSYEQMLAEIENQNLKGEACALEYPNKSEIVDAIVID